MENRSTNTTIALLYPDCAQVEAPDTGEVPVEVDPQEEEEEVSSGPNIPMVAATGAGKQDKADAIKMWAVSVSNSKSESNEWGPQIEMKM